MAARKIADVREKLLFEKQALAEGAVRIAGADEAGRGPLAGPVVCAAVILPLEEEYWIPGVDDSKKLSARTREALAEKIRATAVSWSVAEADNELIDRINILEATKKAMADAARALSPSPDILLIDGNFSVPVPFPQRSIVRGDSLSYSIGAASILAKVHRDRLMEEYDRQYPGYGFAKHKGYGTREHAEAIRRLGLCPIHRRSFTMRILPSGKSE